MKGMFCKRIVNKFYVSIVVLSFLVQGCMAVAGAVAVGMVAGGVFVVYKTVQLATGGEVEVRFAETTIPANDQATLSRARRIAVWPTPDPYAVANWWPGGGDIRLTEELQRYGHFDVVTPHTVKKTAASYGVSTELTELTQRERLQAFETVGNALHADLILYHPLGSWGYDMKPLSFKRGEGTIAFSINVYSTSSRSLIWEQKGQFVIIGGRKTIFGKPEGEEMQQILTSAVAEKFVSVTGRK